MKDATLPPTHHAPRITHHASRFAHLLPPFFAILFAFLGGLTLTRVLFEAWFPALAFLGRPVPVLSAAALLAYLSWFIWEHAPIWPRWRWPLVLLPLNGNLLYLFSPEVDLLRGRVLFLSTLWLCLTLFFLTGNVVRGAYSVSNPRTTHHAPRPTSYLSPLTSHLLPLLLFLIPLYLLTLGRTVGKADTFEFQVVAPQLGIAHPTGYPLYLLLGKLWTLIPIGSVAWRLNLGTAMYGVAAAALLFLLFNRLAGEGGTGRRGDTATRETGDWRLETGHWSLVTAYCSLLTAILFATRPTFWSQAVEAEVYTLHILIVAAALLVMIYPQMTQMDTDSSFILHNSSFIIPLLSLGLTNHLTTVFLIPPALLTLWWQRRQFPWTARWIGKMALIGLLPLLLYLYLPWRWWVVNGETMGWGRFVDWVVGGRFQGALQWTAFLHDPTRYEIVGRLFVQEWGMVGVVAAAIGFLYLFTTNYRAALITFLTWLGFTFYCLNYHVPDLAVFLLPAQLVMAIWIGMALVGVVRGACFVFSAIVKPFGAFLRQSSIVNALSSILITFAFLLLFLQLPTTCRAVDRSADDGRVVWGEYVLNLPLAEGAMILADSEKIAPLYYLQQAEGWRPDLEIRVEPDEAAYRSQLEAAIVRGQTVYLARFLPGLEGIYHLRSVGPLTEVSPEPLTELPSDISPSPFVLNGVALLGHMVERTGERTAAATLYWRASTPINQVLYVYTRWANGSYTGTPIPATGQHPANNYYPTVAWDAGEIVADFHDLPLPVLSQPQSLALQVTLAPPFSDPATLEWHTLARLFVTPPETLPNATPLRIWAGDAYVTGVEMAERVRPQNDLPIVISGSSQTNPALLFTLQSLDAAPVATTVTSGPLWQPQFDTNLPSGVYDLLAQPVCVDSTNCEPVTCGWMSAREEFCILGQIEITGVPLAEGATNYNDLIALLNLDVPETTLQPGGNLTVNLQWQALAPINENYTVFIQVLDANDQIVGQVDSWPVQGTFPTSQWQPGDIINDSITIPLRPDLASGSYRLIVGWYLLATLQRLPVLNTEGIPFGDSLTVPGLAVP